MFFDISFITDMNSIISDKKICVKNIEVEQNDLDKMHTVESNISIDQDIGNNFRFFLIKFKVFK